MNALVCTVRAKAAVASHDNEPRIRALETLLDKARKLEIHLVVLPGGVDTREKCPGEIRARSLLVPCRYVKACLLGPHATPTTADAMPLHPQAYRRLRVVAEYPGEF
jgi:hypothetical protein